MSHHFSPHHDADAEELIRAIRQLLLLIYAAGRTEMFDGAMTPSEEVREVLEAMGEAADEARQHLSELDAIVLGGRRPRRKRRVGRPTTATTTAAAPVDREGV